MLTVSSHVPRPMGMPYVTQCLIVGYPGGLIRDPLACSILTESVQNKTLRQWFQTLMEIPGHYHQPPQHLQLEHLFDREEVTDSAMDIAVTQVWVWVQRMLHEMERHQLARRYQAIRSRLQHDYLTVHTDVCIYPEKLVFELQGYYPMDEEMPGE